MFLKTLFFYHLDKVCYIQIIRFFYLKIYIKLVKFLIIKNTDINLEIDLLKS